MRIIINPADCDGFGFCAQILPELLSLDEWGFPVVREDEVPESLVQAARLAAHLCPRKAVLLLESRNTESRTRVTVR
jgi:ferredoxin